MKNIIKIIGIGIIIFLAGAVFVIYRNIESGNYVGVDYPIISTTTTEKGEGILQGSVTIGPVCTVEIKQKYPTYPCTPTAEMYAAAHVLVYMPDKLTLVKTIIPDAQGKFSVVFPEGEYFVDMIHQRMGGTKGVPVTINITKDKPVILKLEVDTGLR